MGAPEIHATGRDGAAGTVTIQTATFDDVHRLGRVIADAFADLEQNLWLVPDPEARPYVFPAYFALHVELGMQSGTVYTTPDRDAVAVWLPVAVAVPALPDYDIRLAAVAGTWTGRFRMFEAVLGRHHPVYHPHHWLAFLAVAPARQRHGIGTRLMAHHHRILDEQNTPGYLEAVNWTCYDFYRLQGWREHAAPFLIAADGPPMYPMWRQPSPIDGCKP